jgi:hypothetical protein
MMFKAKTNPIIQEEFSAARSEIIKLANDGKVRLGNKPNRKQFPLVLKPIPCLAKLSPNPPDLASPAQGLHSSSHPNPPHSTFEPQPSRSHVVAVILEQVPLRMRPCKLADLQEQMQSARKRCVTIYRQLAQQHITKFRAMTVSPSIGLCDWCPQFALPRSVIVVV